MYLKNNQTVTVITVVYNGIAYIEETIQSVISQTYANIEYIIIDGGSTDDTVNIIKSYEKYLACWISEPDKGIYDAMNKGITLATGDYINFMNGGDRFISNTILEEIFGDKHYEADLIYGEKEVRHGFMTRVKPTKPLSKLWLGMAFSHQALFTKTSVMKASPFNLLYRVAADHDFILKSYVEGKSFLYLGKVVASASTGGLSDKNLLFSHKEHRKIALHYSNNSSKIHIAYFKKMISYTLSRTIKSLIPESFLKKLLIRKYKFRNTIVEEKPKAGNFTSRSQVSEIDKRD